VTATLADQYVPEWDAFTVGDMGYWVHGLDRGSMRVAGVATHLTLSRGIQCAWVDVPIALSKIRDSYNRDYDGPTESQIIETWSSSAVLILEDLSLISRHEGRIIELVLRRRGTSVTTFVISDDPPTVLRHRNPRVASSIERLTRRTLSDSVGDPQDDSP
jgi:DNA replication protein DnaC